MLVLTRKRDQALIINDNVEITVLDIQGDQVRIGIDAPKSVKIFRKELYLEILEENKSAAKHAAQVPANSIMSLLNPLKTENAPSPRSETPGKAPGTPDTSSMPGAPGDSNPSGEPTLTEPANPPESPTSQDTPTL